MWTQYYGFIPGFTQQCFKCLLSLFTTQAGKEKQVCFTSCTTPKKKQWGPGISEAVWQLWCSQKPLRDFNPFCKFSMLQCIAQRSHKLFSASSPGTRIHLIHIPLRSTKTFPLAWMRFEFAPREIFLESFSFFQGPAYKDVRYSFLLWGFKMCLLCK